MISIRVTQSFGASPAVPIQATFTAPGGTIGRGADNTLVLTDPAKHVSRHQANVEVGPAGCLIRCVSAANPIFVNGRELRNGEASALTDGDVIVVAGFEMVAQVTLSGARGGLGLGAGLGDLTLGGLPGTARVGSAAPREAIPDDIFGDLLGTPRSSTPPAQSWPPPPAPMSAPATRPVEPAAYQTPYQAPNQAPNAAPYQAPYQSSNQSPNQAPFAPLPDDFNPFLAMDPPAAHPPPPASNPGVPTDLLSGLGHPGADISMPASADSLDSLFDLGSAKDPFGLDSPLSAPALAPNTSSSLDPLEALSRPAQAPDAPFKDRGDPLQSSINLPGARPRPSPRAPRSEYSPPGPASAGLPDFLGSSSPPAAPSQSGSPNPPAPWPQPGGRSQDSLLKAGAVLSWSPSGDDTSRGDPYDPSAHSTAITRPTSFVEEVNRSQLEAMERARANNPRFAESAAARPQAGQRGHPASSSPSAADDQQFELLKAFLLGIGLPELPRAPGQPQTSSMSPELMRRIGELLRVSIQGTVELLQARAVMKRELRSDVTMIVSRDNNPLKFSPDGTAALIHLLSQNPVKGFLEPAPAMRDAYDDLLAHQLGVVAGMRAAMNGLVQRFDPASLEDKLARRSMLDALLAAPRKARLWELFTERFAELSREAQDDVDAVFWQAFGKAYDEQISRVKAGAMSGDSL